MQLKRSYSRHLNFENDINEFIFNARLANIVIKLAVKTNRPQYFNEQKNEGQIYKKLVHRI